MYHAKLTNEQASSVRKELLFSNVVLHELKESRMKSGNKTILHRVAAGKILKKYRCIKMMSVKTGMSKNSLASVKDKSLTLKKKRRSRIIQNLQQNLLELYERDDNSQCQPGKSDTKTIHGVKIQKRILTDYLANLHVKFLLESPTIKISMASFCRARPKHVLLTSFITRSTCLCTKHQNMALKIKAIRKEGVNVPINPETFVKESHDCDEYELPENVTYSQWKRVEIEEKNKRKSVMRIVQTVVPKETFLDILKKEAVEFRDHITRVKIQYEAIRTLKENLPQHHIILQMDFAENYSCNTMEEIQSAYFNKTGVTIHQVVCYYRGNDGSLEHKSFVAISDVLSHVSSTVIAIIETIIPYIKEIDPDVKVLHYWTDSPISQYRNRFIFNFVANHHSLFGIHARWNYFEAGHGKGPCDGLGGSVNQLAGEAVGHGKATIQDATDFFLWANNSNMASVKFIFVSSEECDKISDQIKSLKIRPVKSIMHIHVVIGKGDSKVLVCNVTCFCDICISGSDCNDWRQECLCELTTNATISFSQEQNVKVLQEPTPDESGMVLEESQKRYIDIQDLRRDLFIAAMYGNKWYIGKILQVEKDASNLPVEVSFMKQSRQMFQWPPRPDVIQHAPRARCHSYRLSD
ncbi:uncharacterized protein LOC121368607 [Gigantopelta aegis]|uniref:uncharacterized protein LOC121368607 n=1 Tax=Gigantopelta aegis TaxID=1735272 RepID=UPI001B887ABC|nr:uncharacterized protein LOC121368607 [Gigantopelta aegis]